MLKMALDVSSFAVPSWVWTVVALLVVFIILRFFFHIVVHIFHFIIRFGLGGLHGMIWVLLILLILLHVGAALYHQFFIKDNLLGRMWYGRQEA